MVKVRQDAWSHEDDLLLAETVLRHIREGGTQLKAFDEVGDKLNRTSAACGFRWNAEVRKRYDQAIDIAKRQRKEKKRAMAKKENQTGQSTPAPTRQVAVSSASASTSTNMNTTSTNVSYNESKASSINLDQVIRYLKDLKTDFQSSNASKMEIDNLKQENHMLKEENQELEEKLEAMTDQLNTIQEDYQVLIQIMDRARKMVVFDDQESMSAKAFRMDKNGNLEQLAR